MRLRNKAQTMKITNRLIHIRPPSGLQRFPTPTAFHKTKGGSGQHGVLELGTVKLWWACHARRDDVLSRSAVWSYRLLKCNRCSVSIQTLWFRDKWCMIRNGKRMLFRFSLKRNCKQKARTVTKWDSERENKTGPVLLVSCCPFIFHLWSYIEFLYTESPTELGFGNKNTASPG